MSALVGDPAETSLGGVGLGQVGRDNQNGATVSQAKLVGQRVQPAQRRGARRDARVHEGDGDDAAAAAEGRGLRAEKELEGHHSQRQGHAI